MSKTFVKAIFFEARPAHFYDTSSVGQTTFGQTTVHQQ